MPDKDPTIASLLSLSRVRTREDYITLAQLSAKLGASEKAMNKQWGDEDTAELQALLAEYTSLRQESMNTINNRTQILVLGLAAIAAIAGASISSSSLTSNSILRIGVFSGAIPLVCVFVFFVWMSEAVRSHRVGQFLASAVEAAINAKLGRLVMSWEAGLWTGLLPRDEWWGPSMMALAVVGILAATAPWVGVLLAGTSVGLHGRPLYEVWCPYAFYSLIVLYTLKHMSRLKNISTVASAMHVGSHEPQIMPGEKAGEPTTGAV
jgi:hypothetical protein